MAIMLISSSSDSNALVEVDAKTRVWRGFWMLLASAAALLINRDARPPDSSERARRIAGNPTAARQVTTCK